ncbi:MAG: 50S ribosomal protein L18 [Candidatus Kerfeldbacteria bacterium]|nr:50S ribosomal protein L18 [Candidatus Kerfeldbacteria bacterium]
MIDRLRHKQQARSIRHRRLRARVRGTADAPRLAVARHLKHIAAQLIDDQAGRTLASATDRELKSPVGTKRERAAAVGRLLAAKAVRQGITKVVFDRGGHRYHGRVQALADGARQAGLHF